MAAQAFDKLEQAVIVAKQVLRLKARVAEWVLAKLIVCAQGRIPPRIFLQQNVESVALTGFYIDWDTDWVFVFVI